MIHGSWFWRCKHGGTVIPVHPAPLASRRQLGAALRQHRIDANLSLKDVADQLLCSPSKVSRIESAQRNISARDVRDLIGVYRITDPDIRARLNRLAAESRETAWWAPYNLPPAYERFIGLEGAATAKYEYQLGVVPGLLQTLEYSASIVSAWTDDPDAVREAAEVRQKRQEFIGQDTDLDFVVDESVFHRFMGDATTMRGQIRKLIELSESSRITFQVIPFSAGAHQGLVSGFEILRFADSAAADSAAEMSDVVFLEGVVNSSYLDSTDEVDGYLKAFRGLQSRALDRQDTLSFLKARLQHR
ncbi:helix-turn-helix domain-containing protein [Actinoplanes palleronii]|uniref:Transcriptional regulator n=1 Tax=Actinoplanes palleronii TaxID=113570 RepID=A0ABQ4B4F3_9ACTN|nr:helix-turn-helix transcriptional regulator [Actinoplanes palleronii]GIE65543.1 transcriptional regulator [Actinoplanes palleronii]